MTTNVSEEIVLAGMAAGGNYGAFCRLALKTIAEQGGPVALDAFEDLALRMFTDAPSIPDEMFQKAHSKALEMIKSDIQSARDHPEMI